MHGNIRISIYRYNPCAAAKPGWKNQRLATVFRVCQRDPLLEVPRLLTKEPDPEKLMARILRDAVEILVGQAGLIAHIQSNGWHIITTKLLAAGMSLDVCIARISVMDWEIGTLGNRTAEIRSPATRRSPRSS